MTTFTTSWVGITHVYNECAPAIYGVVSPAIGATVLVITILVCVCGFFANQKRRIFWGDWG